MWGCVPNPQQFTLALTCPLVVTSHSCLMKQCHKISHLLFFVKLLLSVPIFQLKKKFVQLFDNFGAFMVSLTPVKNSLLVSTTDNAE
jgi:hypothetical protein